MSRTQGGVEHADESIREIRQAVEDWAVWRDAGAWDRFKTVWHTDGFMSATWFRGSAAEFIEVSRKGFDTGVRILHFLGGTSVDVVGDRAIAQTKMTISQRSEVHGVTCDVVCTGRFFDFFAVEDSAWKLLRRQPIYEKDRLDPVSPDAALTLDAERLSAWPEGYRHLAYLQEEAGFTVEDGLPGLVGDAVEHLYQQGADWLDGSTGDGRPR
jgi:hypothetical protein